MKLYLYGYRYGIRTSRKLEREARTNIEAMWLLPGLRPKYKTIADFRKKHSKAFREVFRRFVCLLKEWDLIEGKTVAIDSFKIRGNNSLKNNFNEKKLKRHLEYIDNQIKEYESMLDSLDEEEDKKEILGVENMNALADKGYHTGEQLQQCLESNITTFVSPKAPSTKDIGYNLTRCVSIMGVEKFIKALRERCLHVFIPIKRLILSPFNEFLFLDKEYAF